MPKSTEELTVIVQDCEKTAVWEHSLLLPGKKLQVGDGEFQTQDLLTCRTEMKGRLRGRETEGGLFDLTSSFGLFTCGP